jgi:hypothetical protein
LAISALAFGALLAGCTTALSPPPARAKTPWQEALVCPECKMVAVTTYKPGAYRLGGGPYSGIYRWGRSSYHDQVYEDRCPGCQGIIVTVLKEGMLQHKCSICKEKPFKCPVFHPAA